MYLQCRAHTYSLATRWFATAALCISSLQRHICIIHLLMEYSDNLNLNCLPNDIDVEVYDILSEIREAENSALVETIGHLKTCLNVSLI